jgi:hypothetical protein
LAERGVQCLLTVILELANQSAQQALIRADATQAFDRPMLGLAELAAEFAAEVRTGR